MWLLSGDGWPPRAAWPGIGGSGVLWFGLYMITLNWSEREVDAGIAAMVVTIGPILIALLAGWLLREGFPRHHLRGPRPGRPHVVAHPRPGAPVAHHRRQSAVPGWRRGNLLPLRPEGYARSAGHGSRRSPAPGNDRGFTASSAIFRVHKQWMAINARNMHFMPMCDIRPARN
jgi:hypothetical protein